MVDVPAATPDTSPVVFTVAFALLLFHVPPGTALLNIVVLPMHTDATPVIGATGLTVTVYVLPHPDKESSITTIPGDIPVTMPVVAPIVAVATLVEDHAVPVKEEIKVIVLPSHTLSGPDITGRGCNTTIAMEVSLTPPTVLMTR